MIPFVLIISILDKETQKSTLKATPQMIGVFVLITFINGFNCVPLNDFATRQTKKGRIIK
jgi:flagellar biosynthesis protein FliQ